MASRGPEVVVITGASAGVGRATAREFARHGARIALLARDRPSLEATRHEVEALGGRGLVLPADVADAGQVEAAAAEAEAALGPIDVWVNNAFAGMFAGFLDMTDAEFRRVTAVTYLGQVNGTRAALRRMVPRDHGCVVLVGSALAYRGIPLQSAYCGAKHALQGFQDSLRAELLHAKSHVHVTMVQLSAMNTPQFDWVRSRVPGRPRPVAPVFQPEVAARAIWFAAHARRKEIVVGAPAVEAIVGDKLASGLADRYLARRGVTAQYEPPQEAARPDNLFEPVPGLHRTRGRFTRESRRRAPGLWLSRHRTWIAGAATLATAALVAAGLQSRAAKRELSARSS